MEKDQKSIQGGTNALKEFQLTLAETQRAVQELNLQISSLPTYGGGGTSTWPEGPQNPWDWDDWYGENMGGYEGAGHSPMAILRPSRSSSSGGSSTMLGVGSPSRTGGDSFYIANLNVTANSPDDLVRQLKSLKVVKGLT